MKFVINNMDHFGRGIARLDKKIVFVEGAMYGEIVNAEITKEKKNFSEAKVTNIIEKNENRREAMCPYYKTCGGCNLMHMDYTEQLNFKKEKVKELFKRFANTTIDPDIVYGEELGYRNKITLHKENNSYGLISEDNTLTKIDKCLICDSLINNELNDLSKYNSDPLVIRSNGKDVITSDNNKSMLMEIDKYKFRIDTDSFFQVNNYIASKALEFIRSNIDNTINALDLYSGVGFLTSVVSEKAKKVYSIEINDNSFNNAKYNMEINNINNVILMHGSVEEEIKKIEDKIDLIVTDPPRSGMDGDSLLVINEMRPKKIIYMSCDPATLARDYDLLKTYYNIKDIKLFDMFPNTYHIESLMVLERK